MLNDIQKGRVLSGERCFRLLGISVCAICCSPQLWGWLAPVIIVLGYVNLTTFLLNSVTW